MNKENNAAELFGSSGFNCAQSLLATYGPALGLDKQTALNIGSVMCGGIARMGKTCGAITGALMVIGLLFTENGAQDDEGKAKIYKLSKRFLKEFEKRNCHTDCLKLLGLWIDTIYIDPDMIRGIKKHCQKYVRDAAEIIEEMIEKGDEG